MSGHVEAPVDRGGFVAPLDELDAAAERVSVVARGVVEVGSTCSPRPEASLVAREWLGQAERAWRRQSDGLAADLGLAGQALRVGAESYRGTDRRLAEGLAAIWPAAAWPDPGGVDSAGAGAGRVAVPDGWGGPARSTSAAGIGGASPAAGERDVVQLWRDRAGVCGDVVRVLGGVVVAAPGWSGVAAEAYREWLVGHRARWAVLCEDAEQVVAVLTGRGGAVDLRCERQGRGAVPSIDPLVTSGTTVPVPGSDSRGGGGSSGNGVGPVAIGIDTDGDRDVDVSVVVVWGESAHGEAVDGGSLPGPGEPAAPSYDTPPGGESGCEGIPELSPQPDIPRGGAGADAPGNEPHGDEPPEGDGLGDGAAGDDAPEGGGARGAAPEDARPGDDPPMATGPLPSDEHPVDPPLSPPLSPTPVPPPEPAPEPPLSVPPPVVSPLPPRPEWPGPVVPPPSNPETGPPTGPAGPAGPAVGKGSEPSGSTGLWVGVGAVATAAAAAGAAMFLARRDRASSSGYAPIAGPNLHEVGEAPTAPIRRLPDLPRSRAVGDPLGGWPPDNAGTGGLAVADAVPSEGAGRGRSEPDHRTGVHGSAATMPLGVAPPGPREEAPQVRRARWLWEVGVCDRRPVQLDWAAPAGATLSVDGWVEHGWAENGRDQMGDGVWGASGLGIDGPGSLGVLRGLILLALTREPHIQVLIPAGLARELVDEPSDVTDHAASSGPGGSESSISLRVVPDPLAAVVAAEAVLAGYRRGHPAEAQQSTGVGERQPDGWVVMVPAPTTAATRHRLRALIAAAAGQRIAVFVHGAWPEGPVCVVDGHHRVITHHRVNTNHHATTAHDAATGPMLVPAGTRLVAASPGQLRGRLARPPAGSPEPAPVSPSAAGEPDNIPPARQPAASMPEPATAPKRTSEASKSGAITAALSPGWDPAPTSPVRSPTPNGSDLESVSGADSGCDAGDDDGSAAGRGVGSEADSDLDPATRRADEGRASSDPASAPTPAAFAPSDLPESALPESARAAAGLPEPDAVEAAGTDERSVLDEAAGHVGHHAAGREGQVGRERAERERMDRERTSREHMDGECGGGERENASDAAAARGSGVGGRTGDGGGVSPRLELSILGPIVLRYLGRPAHQASRSNGATAAGRGGGARERVVDGFGPRALELLAFLAVHPDGVGRDALVVALWPRADRRRPTNALNATLARMRATLRRVDPAAAGLIRSSGGRYLLDSDLVTVDYWNLLVGAAHLADPDPQRRARACEAVITAYQGALAVDLTGEWLITLREAARRRYLEALTTLARLMVETNPERTLGLLETARNLEPLAEAIYRDIMWIQYRLGRPEAAAGTLALLQAQLTEIDAAPEPATLELADAIAARTTLPELDQPTRTAVTPGHRSQQRPAHPGVA